MQLLLLTTVCIVCVTGTAASPLRSVLEEWQLFKEKYRSTSRVYAREEETRFGIFKENYNKIKDHNARFARGEVTYLMGINEFADLTTEEFNERFLSFKMGEKQASSYPFFNSFLSPRGLPKFFDWRQHGAVSDVKNQRKCGSCYAFSAIGAIESHHFLKTENMVTLSEQNIVDCSTENNRCHGGWPNNVFDYVIKNGGVATEREYEYSGKEEECKYNDTIRGATVLGYVNIPSGDELRLQEATATIGPVAVCINAGLESFRYYESGVYNDSKCQDKIINHAVLAVGYGTDERGGDYWIVKNSWGAGWGDSGYIKMSRNAGNQCGIATSASYPVV